MVENGKCVPGKRMNLTLSADHRVTNKAEAARFLPAVKRYLENPLMIAFAQVDGTSGAADSGASGCLPVGWRGARFARWHAPAIQR